MDDSSALIEAIAYGGVLCCCCTFFLAVVGGGVYFVMQGQKKSSPTSSYVPSAPSTPMAVPASPFGTPSAVSAPIVSNTPSGPEKPPGDVRATLDGLNLLGKPYLLEASSAFKYIVRWPSAEAHGLSENYQLEVNLDDPNRTARFVEMDVPASGTPGALNVDTAKNDVREALTAVGWRVQ